MFFNSPTPDMEQMQSDQKKDHFVDESRSNTNGFVFTSDEGFGGVQVDAILQNTFELTYACVLIPRFGDHYLTGDITLSLPVWMKEICISYGWRLEAISIRPGYMQWLLVVPPDANPAQVIRVIRQHTSIKILSEFPRYKQQNLAGDFWAPGCSITAGNQIQGPEAISDFIQMTRKQQGIF
jgi:REP element-mobilizing transposase RayT